MNKTVGKTQVELRYVFESPLLDETERGYKVAK